MTYAEKINTLFDVWQEAAFEPGAAEGLLRELGCSVLTLTSGGWSIAQSAQPDPANEALVVKTLLRIMHANVGRMNNRDPDPFFILNEDWGDPFGLLNGLARNNRWELCLENLDDAYRFAELLIFFKRFMVEVETTNALKLVKSDVCAVVHAPLSTWLHLDLSVDEYPSAETLARAMFGDVWSEIVLSTAETGRERFVVSRERPPFLPGLLPGYKTPTAIELPTLFPGSL
jgi:hypothetical protein